MLYGPKLSQSKLGLSYTFANNGHSSQWYSYYKRRFIANVDNSQLPQNIKNHIDDSTKDNYCFNDLYFIFELPELVAPTIQSRAIYEQQLEILKTYEKTLSKKIELLFNELNQLHDEFYNKNIHIIIQNFDQDSNKQKHTNTLILQLTDTLKLYNRFSTKIQFINNSNYTIKFKCDKLKILDIFNVSNIIIDGFQFISKIQDFENPYSDENSFLNTDKKFKLDINSSNELVFEDDEIHLTLVNLQNIDYCEINNCLFDNICPRITPYINNLNFKQTCLSYPTYSLIFINNSKVKLNDCTLKNSNQGVIANCNSIVDYAGQTNLYFENMIWGLDKNKSTDDFNAFVSGTFCHIQNSIPVLPSDFQAISSSIPDYNSELLYFCYQPITNYVAGNSIVNCIPNDQSKILIYHKSNINDEFISNEITKNNFFKFNNIEFNFELGIAQAGSIFNHEHRTMTEYNNILYPSAGIDNTAFIDFNTMNELFDQLLTVPKNNDIGMINKQLVINQFEAQDLNKAVGYSLVNPYNNSIQILQSNLPASAIVNMSVNYNQQEYYSPEVLSTLLENDEYYELQGADIYPFSFSFANLNTLLCLNETKGTLKAEHAEISSATHLFGNFWNLAALNKNTCSGIIDTDIFNNESATSTINKLIKTDYFASVNADNLLYVQLIKNNFTQDSGPEEWCYPSLEAKAKNLEANKNDLEAINAINNEKYSTIGMHLNPNPIEFYIESLSPSMNISDRNNARLRKIYPYVDAERFDKFSRGGWSRYLRGKSKPYDQIANGYPIFSNYLQEQTIIEWDDELQIYNRINKYGPEGYITNYEYSDIYPIDGPVSAYTLMDPGYRSSTKLLWI